MALHDTVRDALPIRLGDRKYNIDLSRLARATIDPIRQGYDTQGQPGEQSLNQAGVWKRTRSDWELGAGQQDADMMESTLREYHTSLGIDPWTKGELKLHRTVVDTYNPVPDATYAFQFWFETAGTKADGDTKGVYSISTEYPGGTSINKSIIGYSTDGGDSFSVITGDNVDANGSFNTKGTAVTSNGTHLFYADNTSVKAILDGVEVATTALPLPGVWTIADIDGLWVANGYLIGSIGARLTHLAGSVANPEIPGTNYDIARSSFEQVDEWVEVLGCPVGIYAAGNQGTRGRIFYVGINNSTSSLDVPIIATELPNGETVNTIAEYGGYIIIGTNKGIRLAKIIGEGHLTYGPRIDIAGGVTHLEEQAEFVWFSWSNYDSHRTGLGRLSMKEFTQEMVPAYASDLMAGDLGPRDPNAGGAGHPYVDYGPVQGPITSLITVRYDGVDTRLFGVYDVAEPENCGSWRESLTNYVKTGTLSEGRFRWGITELKSVVSVDIRHDTLLTGESVALTVADDKATPGTKTVTSGLVGSETPGVRAIADQIPASAGGTGMNPVQGEFIVPSLTLAGPGTSTPTLYRWTTRAIPMPFVAEVIQLPIILTERTEYERREVYQDIYSEYAYIKDLLEKRDLALFIMGDETKNVYVSGVAYEQGSLTQWTASDQQAVASVSEPTQGRRDKWPAGILTVTLITVQTGKDQYLSPTAFSSTG